MPSALDGLRVLELCSNPSGPNCAMMLGYLGADAIKMERPGKGDEAWHMLPFVNGESAPFMLWNRNKRSITVDLKKAAHVFATGEDPARLGQAHRGNSPDQVFRTGDGWITIGRAQDNLWLRLCKILRLPELPDDPRFKTNALRVANNVALVDVLRARLVTQPSVYWLAHFDAAGIPAGPILTHSQAFSNPQVLAREMVADVVHPEAERMKTRGVPVKLSDRPDSIRQPSPHHGEHSAEVLSELRGPRGSVPQTAAGKPKR